MDGGEKTKMSTPTEGMSGTFSIGGTAIALLSGIELNWTRETVDWASMGETQITDVLMGIAKHEGSFKRGFVDWDYYDLFFNKTELVGTIGPIGGTSVYMAGTMVITGGSLSGMQQMSATAVVEECTFKMYNVTTS